MGFRKKDAKISDNKSKSAVIMGKPASQLTKEDKKLLSARMAEIKKENGSNATVQNTLPFLCMFRDGVCQVSENFYSLTVQFYDANYRSSTNRTTFFQNTAILSTFSIIPSSFS